MSPQEAARALPPLTDQQVARVAGLLSVSEVARVTTNEAETRAAINREMNLAYRELAEEVAAQDREMAS